MTQIPGGLWYEDHCLEIVPYKKVAGVRYRYPGENWQFIEGGDDWSIESGSVNDNILWYLVLDITAVTAFANGGAYVTNTSGISTQKLLPEKIINYQILPQDNTNNILAEIEYKNQGKVLYTFEVFNKENGFKPGITCYYREDNESGYENPRNLQFAKYFIVDNAYEYTFDYSNYNECEFIVYKNNQELDKIISLNCPEVELVEEECSKQTPIEIKVQTTPLGFINISNTAINRDGSVGESLPPECVDIYKVIPFIPIGTTVSNTNLGAIYEFIGQYCSEVDCQPPEIKEIDKNNCGQCPPNTCTVDCGDHICCYDVNTGKAIAILNKD